RSRAPGRYGPALNRLRRLGGAPTAADRPTGSGWPAGRRVGDRDLWFVPDVWAMTPSGMREGPKVRGLTAGANRIRTAGPPLRREAFLNRLLPPLHLAKPVETEVFDPRGTG